MNKKSCRHQDFCSSRCQLVHETMPASDLERETILLAITIDLKVPCSATTLGKDSYTCVNKQSQVMLEFYIYSDYSSISFAFYFARL